TIDRSGRFQRGARPEARYSFFVSDVEASIRAAWEANDVDATVTLALRAYGAEIFRLLLALHRDTAHAEDAFSDFAERLFVRMGSFEGKCSMRTWCYMLARHASRDVRRVAGPRARKHVALSAESAIGQLVARVRTQTLSIYAQENRDAVAKLREE